MKFDSIFSFILSFFYSFFLNFDKRKGKLDENFDFLIITIWQWYLIEIFDWKKNKIQMHSDFFFFENKIQFNLLLFSNNEKKNFPLISIIFNVIWIFQFKTNFKFIILMFYANVMFFLLFLNYYPTKKNIEKKPDRKSVV